jgi:hypothetical protein
MTLSEVNLLTAFSDMDIPTTPTDTYTGGWKRPKGYPQEAGAFIRKDGYNCLIKSPTR